MRNELLNLMLSDEQGEKLVRLARKAVLIHLAGGVLEQSEVLDAKGGVFVSLHSLDREGKESLRGCIGFPVSNEPLHHSVTEAAIAAATEDPRFAPVEPSEVNRLVFEVSVLTPPRLIPGPSAGRRSKISIGRDGLILHWKHGYGLLLPQVPVEQGWSIDEYLYNICYKAGAPPDEWKKPDASLYTFEAIVFKEVEPSGRVVRIAL